MKAAEFFAGIGLTRIGLERADWDVVFANDNDQRKLEMYAGHFGEGSGYRARPIVELVPEDIPDINLATASFPCTDLSLAGGRAGLAGARSGAFREFITLLRDLRERRPNLILLENVPAFLTSCGGLDFHRSMFKLNQLGYVVDPFFLNASSWVPQSRPRLFVVGHQAHRIRPSQGYSPVVESGIRPRSLVDYVLRHPEIQWSFAELPEPPSPARRLSTVIEETSSDSTLWWSDDRVGHLRSQMSERHAERLQHMIDGNGWSYGTVFRRMRHGRSMAELRTDGIAGCLRTPKGGSAKQVLVRAGNGSVSVRYLTPRECARLMGADDFVITVPTNQALFGFGDAVCVNAIEWIAKNYLNKFESCSSEECYAERRTALA